MLRRHFPASPSMEAVDVTPCIFLLGSTCLAREMPLALGGRGYGHRHFTFDSQGNLYSSFFALCMVLWLDLTLLCFME
jgi:hypothetical protein